MNPEDLSELGLEPGEIIEIRAAERQIQGIVEADPTVRPGVISMAHAWGGAPSEDAKLRTIGSNTGRLVSNTSRFDHRSGQPLMSAIPVNLRKVTDPPPAA